jgi:hypothetical protein
MRTELEQTLGNCKFSQLCNCTVPNSFESERAPIFYLFDEGGPSEKPVKITYVQKGSQLTVNNSKSKEIQLVKLDKCLIDKDMSKCDCLLFDPSQLFFIELKSSNAGSRARNRKKAREQLGKTIKLLRYHGIDFGDYRCRAIICFKSTEPRIVNSASNSARAEFLQQFDVELEEKNLIDF